MKRIKIPLSILFAAAVAFSLHSCKENQLEDYVIDMGFEYFPLEVGKYRVYQVDSIVYDFDGNVGFNRSSTTYLREEIIDSYVDSEGDTAYILERYERAGPNLDWQIRDVWSAKVASNRAEQVEENLRFVKMVFPLQEGIDFNATLYIDQNLTISVEGETIEAFKNWASQVETVGQPKTVGAFNFAEVTSITYADDENLIEKRYSVADYAKGVGLVFQEEWILDTQELTDALPWEEKAEFGYILRKEILDYN